MKQFDIVFRRLWVLLLPIGIFLHGLWGSIFWFSLFIGKDKQFLDRILENCPDCIANLDAISYAQEVGRLDIISLILTVLGIIVAIAAIGWFGYVRSEARQEARDEIRENGERIISEWIKGNPDVIIRAVQDSYLSSKPLDTKNDTQEEVADQIAMAMSNITREGGVNE